MLRASDLCYSVSETEPKTGWLLTVMGWILAIEGPLGTNFRELSSLDLS
jgi:hypothetical protein